MHSGDAEATADTPATSAFDHRALWQAIDTLAAEHGLTPSGLAREAGLDATAFNPSKRQARAADGVPGAPRWPTLETLARILAATGTSLESFARLVGGARALPPPGTPSASATPSAARTGRVPMLPLDRLSEPGLFDAHGHPQGSGWQDIELPAPVAPGGYVVRLETAHPPLYRPRSLLVVDPDAPLREGDRAVQFDTAGVRLVEVVDPLTPLLAIIPAMPGFRDPSPEQPVPLRLHRIEWASQ